MAAPPNSSTVYNNAAAMTLDSRTPGLNTFLIAWSQLQQLTGDFAVGAYVQFGYVATLIGEFV